MPKQLIFILAALILGLTAVACEGLEGVLTPAPTYTAYPTYTIYPTQTPYPTYIAYPTYTPYPLPEGPSATTPAPTLVVPTPTPLPTVAPTTAPAPTAVTLIVYYGDQDADGFGDPGNSIVSDFPPPGWVTDNTDCDDTDATVHPGAAEILDGVDNDCDSQVDEDLATVNYFADNDGDGYGDSNTTIAASSPPFGYVANEGDCDDTDSSVYPGAEEVLDGKDNNCDGQTDEGLASVDYHADNDGDGYGDPTTTITASSPPSGYVVDGGDCDDSDPAVHPDAVEIADQVDNDCDGLVDEDLPLSVFFADTDGDGYGDFGDFIEASSAPPGYISFGGDCDDTDSSIHTGAAERDDDIDHNCNGSANF